MIELVLAGVIHHSEWQGLSAWMISRTGVSATGYYPALKHMSNCALLPVKSALLYDKALFIGNKSHFAVLFVGNKVLLALKCTL